MGRVLLLLLATVTLCSCSEETIVYEQFFLSITSEAPTDGQRIDRLVLTFRSDNDGVLGLFDGSSADDLRYEINLPSTVDLTTAPYLLQLNPGDVIQGRVRAIVWGMTTGQDRPLATWSGVVDLGAQVAVEVRLSVVSSECDVDGDGLLNCEVAGCCESGEEVLGDCDDSNAVAHPLAPVPECIPCTNATDYDCDGEMDLCTDEDEDGAADCDATADCNPADGTIFAGAAEECDGKDNDCNGVTDDLFTDTDQDGTKDCVDDDIDGDGSLNDDDCAPEDDSVYPGAPELCDGKDNDCNDQTDESPDCADWEDDWDGDGVLPAEDCNNYDSRIFPGSTYTGCCLPSEGLTGEALLLACDFDCDGTPTLCAEDDDDGDGFANAADCAGGENDPTVYPGAPEKCGDGIDQDCLFGDQSCDSVVDADGDKYGADVDCDDNDGSVNPGAAEVCDGKDNDCNGFTDDGNPDGGTGCKNPDPARQFGVCELTANLGQTICGQNLNNPAVPDWASVQADGASTAIICVDFYFPPETESACDELDEDCDGETDEDFNWTELQAGPDGEPIVLAKGSGCGTGGCAGGTVVCHPNAGGRDLDGQLTCDSLGSAISEEIGGGPEVAFCDNFDNDCDGITDGHSLALSQTTCKQLGECAKFADVVDTVCLAGEWQCGYAFDSYDGDSEVRCDGLDNDCDGNVDEDLDWNGIPFGAPCDGTGECGAGIVECGPGMLATCSSNSVGSAPEDTPEVCDAKDNDCDGATDEELSWVWDNVVYPLGTPCEGIGECGTGTVECSTETLAPVCSTNPDGSAPEPSPEVCDGLDNDCDGLTDEDLTYLGLALGDTCNGVGECGLGTVVCSNDGSNVATCSTNANGPEAEDTTELCDALDNNCDGDTDEGFSWVDPVSNTPIVLGAPCDGVGECGLGIVACAKDDDTLATCSTNADGINPGTTAEVCDGLDNDCDGVTDNGLGWLDPELGAVVPLGAPCDGIGQCGAGVVECANDGSQVATCSTNPNGSGYVFAVEICNNLDDDCDGVTDDTDGTSTPGVECALTGVCNAQNVVATCTAGQWFCDYGGVDGYEVSELTCDGEDNDCDGATDEDGLAFPTFCDLPGVCEDAVPQCNGADGWTCEFEAVDGYVASEQGTAFCDNLDNDCDGLTDENFVELGASCTSGSAGCSADGVRICSEDGTTTICSVEGLPAGTPCDDTDVCSFDDECTGGYESACVGTAYDCPSDGLDCTTDVCLGDGNCSYTLLPGFCLIGGVCRNDGSLNPLNDCLFCDDGAPNGWSNVTETTECDDGNSCSTDDACDGAGQCIGNGDVDCNDGLECTLDSCVDDGGGQFSCDNSLKPESCLIDGACYADGVQNPSNPCELCDASTATDEWTDRADNTPCTDGNKCTLNDMCDSGVCSGTLNPCDDGNECTDDSCDPEGAAIDGCVQTNNTDDCTDDGLACTDDECSDGACTHPIKNKRCVIDGVCFNDKEDDPENECQECDDNFPTVWTPKNSGANCDDGLVCTTDSECDGAGTCAGIEALDCDDGNECTNDSCAEPGGCVNTPADGSQCTDDGLPCTADQCDGSTCVHTPTFGACAIDGSCFLSDAVNVANECEQCNPSLSQTDWSAKTNGTSCNADGDGCTTDVCTAGACTVGPPVDCSGLDGVCTVGVCVSQDANNGTCTLENKPNGTGCTDDGLPCTTDQCLEGLCDSSEVSTGCLIDGACVNEGALSPDNTCQSCQNAEDTGAYSNLPASTDCSDDALDCTTDQCDGAGNCVETVNSGTCLIDNACYNADTLSPTGCESCQPGVSATSWTALPEFTPCVDSDGLTCTTGQCNDSGQCIPVLVAGNCLVGGECYSDGEASPDNPCEACLAATSVNTFSTVANDTPCGDDGNECTNDTCQAGACNTAVSNGTACGDGNECLVNECQAGTCDTSAKSDGTACTDDGNECTVDTCQAGVCNSPVADDTVCTDDGNECTANTCQSGTCSAANVTDGTGCTDDGNECTVDTCQAGVCNSPVADDTACTDDGNECTTNTCQTGTCTANDVTDGTACTDDGNECTTNTCQTGTCTADNVADGTACTDDGNECTTNTCQTGTCTADNVADGTACTDDGLTCTMDSCTAGTCSNNLAPGTCLIDGVCYADGDEDPGAACQFCQAGTNTAAWTTFVDESDAEGTCGDGIDNDCDGQTDDDDESCGM